jgi:SAM-dependent methyltransferase
MTTATALTIVKIQRPEDRVSAEYRTQLAQLTWSAGRLHPEPTLIEVDAGDRDLPVAVPGPVLLVGPGAVLLGPRSLQAMHDALGADDGIAVPYHLGATALAAEMPPFTRRGIERIEGRFLAEDPPRAPAHGSHLPVALFHQDAWRRALDSVGAHRLLTDHEALAGVPLLAAGLCHPFIDYYGEARADVLPFLSADAADVLEIGCARGRTGRLIADHLGCRVTGVEMNPEAAADAARALHRVVAGDVMTVEIEGRFDAIVATELFEHLTDQQRFLEHMRALLAPGGRLVLSVPNVGHWSIVDDLLAGRWDYLPIGLLCSTHYRFFTEATLREWLETAGFTDLTIEPQTTEVPPRFEDLCGFEVDRESLATSGFWVVARP